MHIRIDRLVRQFSEKEHFRIWLVHNPAEFACFPDGTVDIMFSGHTHGMTIQYNTIEGVLYSIITTFKGGKLDCKALELTSLLWGYLLGLLTLDYGKRGAIYCILFIESLSFFSL